MLDVAIVGGGLCGVALAHSLQARHTAWMLFEARDRLGGRVLTQIAANGVPLDLGPTWYWPATQPSIARLVDELGLASFDQADDGRVLLLDDPNRTPRAVAVSETGALAEGAPAQPGAVHGGARRLAQGTAALIDALTERLPTARLRLGVLLERLVDHGDHVELHLRDADRPVVVTARHVVLALPPRVAEASVEFEPRLPDQLSQALRATPTWMASAAKAAVAYPRAFWRDQGHTGNAWVTHPQAVLAEVFDASPPSGECAALAGFNALGVKGRQTFRSGLAMLIESQLAMLFGPDAQGGELHRHDWAEDPLSCSALDRAEDGVASAHPRYGNAGLDQPQWQGRLLFGGSETARRGGGYLEGALSAAARLREQLAQRVPTGRPAAANDAHADPFAPWLQWVGGQREDALQRYRREVHQSLARQDDDQLTQRALLGALEGLYAEALEALHDLPLRVAHGPAELGRHALTPQVLQPFKGLSDELLDEALRFNNTSCALSNFPFEHRPNAEYVQTIRRDLAAAWRAFALSVNDCLHRKTGAVA